MIKINKYNELGRHTIDWLDARYHFSFSSYYNPERMGFGLMRVINDDIIKAGTGFATHPHRDMEIITYVRKGAITHQDSKGNKGRTEAGDVQVMSAGSGIFHSEHNLENIDTNLFQIWIEPNKKSVEPRWDAARFPKDFCKGELRLLVSGRDQDKNKQVLYINQYAAIFGGRIKQNDTVTQKIENLGYLLVSEGEIKIDDKILSRGDSAEISKNSEVTILAVKESEILLIDVPE